MNTSTLGLAELIGHESIVTRRYRDSAGVWKVGVGHVKAAGAPDPSVITTDLAVSDLVALFRKDIAAVEKDVRAALRVPVTQNEFDALVSFHFDTGSIYRASLTKSLNSGDRSTAAAQFMHWNKPPEVIDRRMAEMILFRDGVYSCDGKAAVYPATNGGAVLWGRGKRVPLLPLLEGDATP
ncbi:MAG: lysozyme, partial [Hansschlegelia sp.]